MTQRPSRALPLVLTLLAGTACEMVLGFEDHQLLPASAAEGGSAGVAGSSGSASSAGTAGVLEAGSAGAAGETGTGGSGGSGAAGGSGASGGSEGGSAGSAGEGGTGPDCLLCTVETLLVHRYAFDGTGSEATDSVGSAHGTLVGPTLDGSGTVTLSGTDQYVNLPNQLISGLGDASFEVWLTWDGNANWERVFDFGDETDSVEDAQSLGRTYLFLTPRAGTSGNPIRVVYSANTTDGEVVVNSTSSIAAGELTQLVVVVDGTTLRLYRNGVVEGFAGPIGSLSAINDINNWLGRSQFAVDPELGGTLHDFRIYAAALSPDQIAALYGAGADTTFGD